MWLPECNLFKNSIFKKNSFDPWNLNPIWVKIPLIFVPQLKYHENQNVWKGNCKSLEEIEPVKYLHSSDDLPCGQIPNFLQFEFCECFSHMEYLFCCDNFPFEQIISYNLNISNALMAWNICFLEYFKSISKFVFANMMLSKKTCCKQRKKMRLKKGNI